MLDAKLVYYNGTGGVQNPALVLDHDEDSDECKLVVLGVHSDGGNISQGTISELSNVPKGSKNQGHTWS